MRRPSFITCSLVLLAAAALALPSAGCARQADAIPIATDVILPGEQTITQSAAPPADNAAPAAEQAATTTAAASAPAAASSAPPEPATAAATGSDFAEFRGRITVVGNPPSLSPLMPKDAPAVQDKVCVMTAIPDDSLVVGPDNGLADVFVYAKKLPSGVTAPPASEEPAQMDQKSCRFTPQALVFRVGQPLLLLNSDPVSHNVRTAGFTKQVNQIIKPNETEGIPIEYDRPERVPVQTKCDIHAWMSAYHLPLDHPWAALTGEDGAFVIKDLPAGDWEFVVWHGRTGNIDKGFKFSAKAGEVVTHDFPVPAAKLTK